MGAAVVANISKQPAPPSLDVIGGRRFGRLIAKDRRDSKFALASVVPATDRYRRHWHAAPALNQGSTSQCVAYSIAGWLAAGPVRNTLPLRQVSAWCDMLYAEAQERDEWPGAEPDYEGTSVRAGMKVLKDRGFIGSYRWAWDAHDVGDWILTKGPVVVGTTWYRSMMTPASGFILPLNESVGGHAYLLIGVDYQKKCPGTVECGAFRVVNSWGRSWGTSGRAWLRIADFQKLLGDGGEACASDEIDLDAIQAAIKGNQ